jgi:hypothetical protein
MARKTIIVVWLVALAFAPFCPVEAQQPKKIPSEDRADNVPRQGDLNHEGILRNSAGGLPSPPAASENIFFI